MPEYINRASALLQKAEKMNIKKAVQCIKMYSMPNQQYETIRPYIEGSVSSDTKAVTDGGHNLIKLKEILKEHKPYPETEDEIHEVVKSKLPWVHIAVVVLKLYIKI